jgi:hypothetical protein
MTGTMRIFESRKWKWMLLLGSLFLPSLATAEVTAKITSVSIGFAGHYKLGYWVPVFVSLDCQGRGGPLTIELTVPDGDGVPSTTTAELLPNDFSASGTTEVELYCKIGRRDGEFSVVVREAERTVARTRYLLEEFGHPPLPSDAQLLLAIGETPNILRAVSEDAMRKRANVTLAQITADDHLPSEWFGYDCVDQVIVAGSRPEITLLTDHPDSTDALIAWIRIGGNLLLSIGPGAEHFLKPEGPLAVLAPGRFVELASSRQLNALETFAEATDPLIKEDDRGRAEDFSIPFFEPGRGTVLITNSSGLRRVPLLIRRALGFGQVTLLAMDLEQPEFANWNGTRKLVGRLLFGATGDREQELKQTSSALAHTGYDDLAGQLRAALDRFEAQGVRFIPFELLFLLGVVYLLLIAPGDYFFLKRFVGRMHLTWITFPLLVVLISTGTYFFARAMKGDRRLVNQAELVDIDVATGQIRAACWFSIFSPQTDRYDLSARCVLPTVQAEKEGKEGVELQAASKRKEGQLLLSWMGLPGTGLGGMESPISAPQSQLGYLYGPQLATMRGVPIPIWSTKCFTARYQGQNQTTLRAELSVRESHFDPRIRGSITNLLTTTLDNCILLHEGWVYPLGTIKPMQTVRVGKDISIRTVRNYLARLGPWDMETDTERNEISRIFERMTFYHAADSTEVIPLKNAYLKDVDITPLLEDQSAVLIGWIRSETFQLLNHAEAVSNSGVLRSGMYRFMLPVQRLAKKK